MSVSLQKGQKVSLSKDNSGLDKIVIGLGWDEVAKKGGFFSFLSNSTAIDCDASAFLLQDGKLKSTSDIVYFGNLNHSSGAVKHMGDNLTGEGDGDDEQIVVKLNSLPQNYDKIILIVNIYDPVNRKQDFGMIKNAFIRLVDARNNSEICKYNLSENYQGSTSMIFGEVYRHNEEWKFNAIGQATNDTSISEIARKYR